MRELSGRGSRLRFKWRVEGGVVVAAVELVRVAVRRRRRRSRPPSRRNYPLSAEASAVVAVSR